jgi:MFS family permease
MLSAQMLAVIGMFNVFGSLLLGWMGGIMPKQILLGLVYVARSLTVALYFLLPASPLSTLVFAAVMGMLGLGVVPLVNGLVADIFGTRFMGMLTGVAFLSHQVGSFVGVWGGGIIYEMLGSYDRAWQAGVAIGLTAGMAQLMMSVRPAVRVPQPA